VSIVLDSGSWPLNKGATADLKAVEVVHLFQSSKREERRKFIKLGSAYIHFLW
jgi:hypothetical protein